MEPTTWRFCDRSRYRHQNGFHTFQDEEIAALLHVLPSMWTSHTHPLRIADIATGSDRGKIGITFAPGKKQPAAMSGAWDRDLATDLDGIAAWNAAAVVTGSGAR
jgi:hypothetical protein